MQERLRQLKENLDFHLARVKQTHEYAIENARIMEAHSLIANLIQQEISQLETTQPVAPTPKTPLERIKEAVTGGDKNQPQIPPIID